MPPVVYEDVQGNEERFEIHWECPSGEEDGGTLPLECAVRSSDLRRHQKNVTGVVDKVVWDYLSLVNDLEAVTLVESESPLVLLEDQQTQSAEPSFTSLLPGYGEHLCA